MLGVVAVTRRAPAPHGGRQRQQRDDHGDRAHGNPCRAQRVERRYTARYVAWKAEVRHQPIVDDRLQRPRRGPAEDAEPELSGWHDVATWCGMRRGAHEHLLT